MFQRTLMSLPLVALAVLASTRSAFAAFDPSRDELLIGTFLVALGLMLVLLILYGIKWYFGLDKEEDVEIPDHAHDHRYAGTHH